MKHLSDLDTPCLILNRQKLLKNIHTMHTHLDRLGVTIRPHAKTPKNIDIVSLALKDRLPKITVSTVKEAEYFCKNNIKDMIYAVGIAPHKLDRIARLIKQGAHIAIVLDTLEQVRACGDKARKLEISLPVYIEIDCDGHRSGVTTDDPILIDIGQAICSHPNLTLQGILTHAGESYHCQSSFEIEQLAHKERRVSLACQKN